MKLFFSLIPWLNDTTGKAVNNNQREHLLKHLYAYFWKLAPVAQPGWRHDCVSFYSHFNEISVQTITGLQTIKKEILQQLERWYFLEKTLLWFTSILYSYASTDVNLEVTPGTYEIMTAIMGSLLFCYRVNRPLLYMAWKFSPPVASYQHTVLLPHAQIWSVKRATPLRRWFNLPNHQTALDHGGSQYCWLDFLMCTCTNTENSKAILSGYLQGHQRSSSGVAELPQLDWLVPPTGQSTKILNLSTLTQMKQSPQLDTDRNVLSRWICILVMFSHL